MGPGVRLGQTVKGVFCSAKTFGLYSLAPFLHTSPRGVGED